MEKDKFDQEQENSQEQQAVSLYKHVKELSILKFDSELRREDSLIQQSSQMQTAFSFMTAAVLMATPVLIEYRGALSLRFFFVAVSSIIAALLTSLVFASLAQRRVLKRTFMNIPEIEKFVSEHYEQTLSQAAQLKQWVQVVGDVQVDLDKTNNQRVWLIRLSMKSFFVSIFLIVMWFVIGIAKII